MRSATNFREAPPRSLSERPPRSGREMLGRYAWLARLIDKVRAEHAGAGGEYVAYCRLSRGFLAQTGVSAEVFDTLIRRGSDDLDVKLFFDKHVSDAQRNAANKFVLADMRRELDAQDAEEGRS
jgi:hypothetical protein